MDLNSLKVANVELPDSGQFGSQLLSPASHYCSHFHHPRNDGMT